MKMLTPRVETCRVTDEIHDVFDAKTRDRVGFGVWRDIAVGISFATSSQELRDANSFGTATVTIPSMPSALMNSCLRLFLRSARKVLNTCPFGRTAPRRSTT